MKLVDRLNLASVNMAVKLNFNNLLKRINALIERTDDLETLTADSVVNSFAGRTGVVVPRLTDYDDYFVQSVAGKTGVVTLDMGDVTTGNLAASRLSGQVALANGGTAADLSATGGAGQVLKQSTAGGAITVGTLASTSLSDAASIVYVGDTISNATFEGVFEPTWVDTAQSIVTKCYLRAKAAGAGDVYGVFVPHRIKLGSTTIIKSTASSSTTNCTITSSSADEYGIKFEITSTAAGDCYATAEYNVRPDAV